MRMESKLRRMLTRRRFVGMLAVLPAVTALAGSGLRLPSRHDIVADDEFEGPLFATDGTSPWSYSNTLSTSAELSEKSLQDLLNQIRDNQFLTSYPMSARPTKLIVPRHLAARAKHVLEHEATLGERLWWWLSNSEYRNA